MCGREKGLPLARDWYRVASDMKTKGFNGEGRDGNAKESL
jgi:hypothetical protein